MKGNFIGIPISEIKGRLEKLDILIDEAHEQGEMSDLEQVTYTLQIMQLDLSARILDQLVMLNQRTK